ncbi:hypothetical protein [Bradyrhizobium sp. 1(2017)]|uniref:hypothetical protein n=1 Tax=Bradyrhizobium sp. 1(2017) TaxID=1404888 RepID=UPI00140EA7B4|nr:hypothetical protein [Bradyrhizobium sp. 1(2017)]QIO36061.1 hypothetical protein HAP40_31740 [Bradyrhizobium sp. 1(2017)]
MENEVADILTELRSNLPEIFKRMPVKRLAQYDRLQKTLHTTDVSVDSAYQRDFADFYKLRGPQTFRQSYFALLNVEKTESDSDFLRVLQAILDSCNQVHASFASKLLATVNANLPVYDSEVLKRLRLSNYAGGSVAARMKRGTERYQAICRFHKLAKEEPLFSVLIAEFDTAFSEFAHFTGAKKLDLILWQSNRTDA